MTIESPASPKTQTVLRWVIGVYFIAVGVVHFVLPEGLPEMMSWMYDLSDTSHLLIGTAEILGGLGLILPAVTGIMPRLSSIAAMGLSVVMVGAIIWHLSRGEAISIAPNILILVASVYLASSIWKTTPPLG